MDVRPLTFELRYRKEAYKRIGGKFIRDEARDETLPDRPAQFSPLRSDHPTIAARADELNRAQERSGFRHYFFFPEVAAAH